MKLLFNRKIQNLIGWYWTFSTQKVSSRGETFPHTDKLITGPFHNRWGETKPVCPSHEPASPMTVLLETCINLGSDTSVEWYWTFSILKVRDGTFLHTYKMITSLFYNRWGTISTNLLAPLDCSSWANMEVGIFK